MFFFFNFYRQTFLFHVDDKIIAQTRIASDAFSKTRRSIFSAFSEHCRRVDDSYGYHATRAHEITSSEASGGWGANSSYPGGPGAGRPRHPWDSRRRVAENHPPRASPPVPRRRYRNRPPAPCAVRLLRRSRSLPFLFPARRAHPRDGNRPTVKRPRAFSQLRLLPVKHRGGTRNASLSEQRACG